MGSGADEFAAGVAVDDEDLALGLRLLARGRVERALDVFEAVAERGDGSDTEAQATALVIRCLLWIGAPNEAQVWLHRLEAAPVASPVAGVLGASVRARLGDLDAARAELDALGDGPRSDGVTHFSTAMLHLLAGQLAYDAGDLEAAERHIAAAMQSDLYVPDVFAGIVMLCAEVGFDPSSVVERLDPERLDDVLAWSAGGPAAGLDRFAEACWARFPGDRRVLAAAAGFAPRGTPERALEWSARLRAVGADDQCPLRALARDADCAGADRIRAAALAAGAFGDDGLRDEVEAAAAALAPDEIEAMLREVLQAAPEYADAVVVGAAGTCVRSLVTATALWRVGALDEAYSVLAYGLTLPDADEIDAARIRSLVPVAASDAIAAVARTRGDRDVVDVLDRVAQELSVGDA